jgi:hypothetical protein
MPVFSRPTDRPQALIVAFWRDGQELERRHTADGEDAYRPPTRSCRTLTGSGSATA